MQTLRHWQAFCFKITASLLFAIALSSSPSPAAQFPDGRVAFDSPPRLVDFRTTRDDAGDRRPTYYATVELLPSAGEPLKTLTVSLIEGRFLPRLAYRLEDIEVFQGTWRSRGQSFALEAVDYDEENLPLTIRLSDPVLPGQMVTFALTPSRNPSRGGVYLFEVAAAPDGEQPVIQRIGTGRLNIFREDRNEEFWHPGQR